VDIGKTFEDGNLEDRLRAVSSSSRNLLLPETFLGFGGGRVTRETSFTVVFSTFAWPRPAAVFCGFLPERRKAVLAWGIWTGHFANFRPSKLKSSAFRPVRKQGPVAALERPG